MLVLTRKKGERILIGDCVILTLVECKDGRVRLGFEAPDTVAIYREEILNEFQVAGPRPEANEAVRLIENGDNAPDSLSPV